MRAVLQRVSRAKVTVDDEVTGEIGRGVVLLAGCAAGDTDADFQRIAQKTATLRLFPSPDDSSHFDRSLMDVGGSVLAVSQFTLLGDCAKGRRPSFSAAMPVEEARNAFERFVVILKETGLPVATGKFQAMMKVELVNDGPVTLLIDSRGAL